MSGSSRVWARGLSFTSPCLLKGRCRSSRPPRSSTIPRVACPGPGRVGSGLRRRVRVVPIPPHSRHDREA